MLLRAVILILLCLGANSAFAKDYGKWLCTDCVVRDLPNGGAIPNAGEVTAFIKAEVNQTVQRWQPNDTVTICDGQKCVSLLYHASGNFLVGGPPYNDTRSNYKNVSASTSVSSSPAGSFGDMTVTISWRLVDVYILDHGSGNETYLGSYYEITGISVSGSPLKPFQKIPM
ncbi:hypothetical protein ACTJKJ_12465 [Roseateles sp. 22389]|jgi:hypothetical protein|uniref:hypothetical protein n=1 Tax=Roseateles sp. 22389 TaxID=3453916 RepID=UPI003F878BE1